jgi:sodium transport system permease protein
MNSRWTGAIIVFLKELKDILRDRRTIMSMVLVPMLVYPLISVGFGAIIASQIERTQAAQQTVLVLPAGISASEYAMLGGMDKIKFIPPDTVHAFLSAEAARDTSLNASLIGKLFTEDPAAIPDSIKAPLYFHAIKAGVVRAVVEWPSSLAARLGSGDSTVINTYADETDLKSQTASDNLHDWAVHVRDSIVVTRLAAVGMNRATIHPIVHKRVDVAPATKKSGFLLAMMLPYMMVILMLTGGMYPALDITAGEKERNTLETLLVAPVSRWHLAVGKFLTVFVAGIVTMLMSMTSMVLTFKFGAFSFSRGDDVAAMTRSFSMSPTTLVWVALLMIPMAVLFASILITIGISARSYKEGQSYATPMLMACIFPAMISLVPGIQLNPSLAFIPVVNMCLALKEVLLGTQNPAMIGLVFLSTAIYAAFALFIATRMFQRESVLFRT